jgi:hypothetical protein
MTNCFLCLGGDEQPYRVLRAGLINKHRASSGLEREQMETSAEENHNVNSDLSKQE